MPVSPTYPGVYIEEISSGVRTITGVATSITAFVGRALRGPVSEPITINNFGDFERVFGGLVVDFPLSYTVRDFYSNGGSAAIIVRLYKPPSGSDGKSKVTIDELKLEAAYPGEWGNQLFATIDTDGIDADVAERFAPLIATELFNLTIVEKTNGGSVVSTEQFRNVSVKEGPRRIDRVLAEESRLVRVQLDTGGDPDLPTDAPTATAETQFADGKESDDLAPADFIGKVADKTGLHSLEKADLFNLLCIPPDEREEDTDKTIYQAAMNYCVDRRAMLIVDPPAKWGKIKETAAAEAKKGLSDLGLTGLGARNAAIYFPRVVEADLLREGQLDVFVPCGIVAGVMARTDTTRGVWKAPAGIDASLNGTQGLQANLTDDENGILNPLGINCLRRFPVTGRVVWGARTLRGADQSADEYKYVPVRRLALFIEESLYRGTQWAVFEPNDEPLWAQLRLNIGAFMQNLFRQGAFQGQTPKDAYFVKADKETTTQNDINLGIVNIIVGFAPLKPAEFVIIKIQQIAGQIDT